MAKKDDLTPLSSTGRKYLDGTARARLQSPGIEHYPSRGAGRARTIAIAVVLAAALVGVLLRGMQGR